jgi:hypothetical protein
MFSQCFRIVAPCIKRGGTSNNGGNWHNKSNSTTAATTTLATSTSASATEKQLITEIYDGKAGSESEKGREYTETAGMTSRKRDGTHDTDEAGTSKLA